MKALLLMGSIASVRSVAVAAAAGGAIAATQWISFGAFLTDAVGLAWLVLPFAAAAAAVDVWAEWDTHGELGALASLGVSRARAMWPALIGGAIVVGLSGMAVGVRGDGLDGELLRATGRQLAIVFVVGWGGWHVAGLLERALDVAAARRDRDARTQRTRAVAAMATVLVAIPVYGLQVVWLAWSASR